jgi:catechol 2,3-dioxygenase-like lactoylglutathione lyase family enzyme
VHIEHIGVIVDDLAAARHFLSEVLGLELDREAVIPGRLEAAFFRCGSVAVELIEVREPEERQRRLRGAPAHIEHIAIQVESLDDTIADLRGKGVETTTASASVVGTNISYFTKPESTNGVMYQFFERRETQENEQV